jgi:hypothetical protein
MRRMVLVLALLSACQSTPPPSVVPVAYEETPALQAKVQAAMDRLETRIETRQRNIAADVDTLNESAGLLADVRAYMELSKLRDRVNR